jgi:5'-nucleotidase
MEILLTNDDGIYAVGLRSMYKALVNAGHRVYVVAPHMEQSAVGHAVTLSSPLRVKEVTEDGFRGWAISGTPADCVKIALGAVLGFKPDLIVSGINAGANVGVDILYSGTVSAATEGALAGMPALAVSIDHFQPTDLDEQATFAVDFVARQRWSDLPKRCVLNLNFPVQGPDQWKGLKVCPQTQAVYNDWYERRQDPRGSFYYWLCGEIPKEKVGQGTDRDLLSQGYVTLTPLRFDFNYWEVLANLSV